MLSAECMCVAGMYCSHVLYTSNPPSPQLPIRTRLRVRHSHCASSLTPMSSEGTVSVVAHRVWRAGSWTVLGRCCWMPLSLHEELHEILVYYGGEKIFSLFGRRTNVQRGAGPVHYTSIHLYIHACTHRSSSGSVRSMSVVSFRLSAPGSDGIKPRINEEAY